MRHGRLFTTCVVGLLLDGCGPTPRVDLDTLRTNVAVQAAFIQANRMALENLALPAAGENYWWRGW